MTIETTLSNPNPLQIDSKAGAANQDSSDNCSLRCPHCRQLGVFRSALPNVLEYDKQAIESTFIPRKMRAKIMICPNQSCKGIAFVVEHRNKDLNKVVACYPPQIIDFDSTDIPEALVRTIKEAITCHANAAYRASAMMVRRLLEELCDDAGAKGKDLHQRLKELRSKITMPQDLFDGMSELKSLGNDAAHIEARAYLEIDQEESEISIELAKEILKARFQHKSLINRLKARKEGNVSNGV